MQGHSIYGAKMPSGILSKLNTTIYSGFRRAIVQRQGGWQSSLNLVLRPGNLLFRYSALSRSLPYSTSLISEAFQFSKGRENKRKLMAASTSKAVLADVYVDDLISSCGNALDFTKPTGVFYNDRSRGRYQNASLSLRRKEWSNSHLICGYFIFDGLRRNCNPNSLVGPWLKNFHSSSSVCHSTGAAHDVSFDGNSHDEQLADSTILSGQYVLLFLLFSVFPSHFNELINIVNGGRALV